MPIVHSLHLMHVMMLLVRIVYFAGYAYCVAYDDLLDSAMVDHPEFIFGLCIQVNDCTAP